MSDSPFLPKCSACRLLRAVIMFIISYNCFNLTMSDYNTGSMIFSTESNSLNEAILTCIVLTGTFCIGYGIALISSLFRSKDQTYEHEADSIQTP